MRGSMTMSYTVAKLSTTNKSYTATNHRSIEIITKRGSANTTMSRRGGGRICDKEEEEGSTRRRRICEIDNETKEICVIDDDEGICVIDDDEGINDDASLPLFFFPSCENWREGLREWSNLGFFGLRCFISPPGSGRVGSANETHITAHRTDQVSKPFARAWAEPGPLEAAREVGLGWSGLSRTFSAHSYSPTSSTFVPFPLPCVGSTLGENTSAERIFL